MKVKVTIDLADKAQAAAFQNLVSAQAAAAQREEINTLSIAHLLGRKQPQEPQPLTEEGEHVGIDYVALADKLATVGLTEEEQKLWDTRRQPYTGWEESTENKPATKKPRAPRKTKDVEEQPVDTAATENVEVNEPEEVTDAATNIFAKKLAEKAKAQIDAANEAASEKAPLIENDDLQRPNNPVDYTEQEVRQLVADKVNAHRPVIVAKLNALGSKSVTLLPKEKYGELVAFLNGLD